MSDEAKTTQGEQHRTWEIGTGLPGAPNLHLAAHFNLGTGQFEGQGRITQAVAPPGVDIETVLLGRITTEVFGGRVTHRVEAVGKPPMGPEPRPENCKLEMTLAGDLDTGTASFSYRDREGQWVKVDNAKVKPAKEPVSAS